jgi:hypothetical protein
MTLVDLNHLLVGLMVILLFVAAIRGLIKDWRYWFLFVLPLILIFLTAYLGRTSKAYHRVINIIVDGIIIFNAYYFYTKKDRATAYIYIVALIAIFLDFFIHGIIGFGR